MSVRWTVLIVVACGLAASLPAQDIVWADLQGEWRRTSEDRPEFALPEFDDRQWAVIRLPYGEFGPRRERIWLRRRVVLPPGAHRVPLTLTLGTHQGLHQIFINGRYVADYGVSTPLLDGQINRPRTILLPAGTVPENGVLHIALRQVFRRPIAPQWRLPDRGPYLITTQANAPLDAGPRALDQHRLELSPMLVIAVVHLGLALVSFLGWITGGRSRELLWFAIYSCAQAGNLIALLAGLADPNGYPFLFRGLGLETLLLALTLPTLAEALLSTLPHRSRWLHLVLWLGWSVHPISVVFRSSDNRVENWDMAVSQSWCAFFILGLVVWISRSSGRENLLFRLALLVPVLERLDYWTGQILQQPALFPRAFFAGGHRWHPNVVLSLIVSAVILAILLRRLAAARREQDRLAGELESARVVQQFLVSKTTAAPAVPLEAVYEPAHEVGGDFYQTFALPDGSLLLAVGDVSGKGLKAAMVVSLLAGAFRNRKSDDPAALLRELNAVVTGGLDGGFVTATVARCHADGTVVLANAGNPAPYVAGAEVALDPGFPLGLDRDAEYLEHQLVLQPGQQLTFVSDGVIEAENPQRELFGFDRTREISGKSAQEIAEAAKAWGQNDDITVVTVRRRIA